MSFVYSTKAKRVGSERIGRALPVRAEQNSGSPHLGGSVRQTPGNASRDFYPLQEIVENCVQAASGFPAQMFQFFDTRNAVPVVAAAVLRWKLETRGGGEAVQHIS